MAYKNLMLKWALVVVVVGLCSGFGQSRELLEDMSYNSEKFEPEKTLRELRQVHKPRDAAELLAATRANRVDKIGKYTKSDYLGLLHVEPRDCLIGELNRRRALCKAAADLAGLKSYCDYFVGQLEEYCSNTATWRIIQAFIESESLKELLSDVQFFTEQVDNFTRSSGDERQSDESNLLAYCKAIDMRPRISQAHSCSRFNLMLDIELKRYVPDSSKVISYLDSQTKSAEGTFARAASRCKMMVDKCYKPVAAFI